MQQIMRISLKAARINKGLRQTDVAVALGVDRKTIASWENGRSMPNASKIPTICEVLGVAYDNINWKV